MADKKGFTFTIDTTKIMTTLVITALLGIGKIGFDAWAVAKVVPSISKKLKDQDEKMLAFGSTLEEKADKVEIQRVEKKVDKILTILCTMNNKPTDCAN